MNTLEMMIAAQGTNDVYKCGVYEYSTKNRFKTRIAQRTEHIMSIDPCINGFLSLQNWIKASQFTDTEITILKAIDAKYKWIARDNGDTGLYVYRNKPLRGTRQWCGDSCDSMNLMVFNHLFQSITWESEPVEIAEVIR